MKIDFSQVPVTVMPNFRGGEKEALVRKSGDDLAKVMEITLVPGAAIGLHTHVNNSEMIYVISGTGTMICDGEEEILTPGMAHYCPKGHSHTFLNLGTEDLLFFAVVPEQP